jgi:NADPH-dependent glutamate synthase beta subunit-like oxidoreductase
MLVDLIRFGSVKPEKIFCQSGAVISGGGKLALQAAKICKDLGADTVTILFRESWKNSPITDADVDSLGIEGINIIYDAALNRLLGEENRLIGIDYIAFDSLTKTTIPAQTLIIASGRFPELVFVKSKPVDSESEESSEPATDQSAETILRWEAIQPYRQPAFKNVVGLFAEGDVVADYSAAIKAIGAGRRAAASIHQIMWGIEPSLSDNVVTPQSAIQNVDSVEDIKARQRQIMPICSGRELMVCGEIERGFSEDMAQAEAARCLQCGLICYERSVETAAKELAVASV